MGILALINLNYFVSQYNSSSVWILKNCQFPFAITSINITALLIKWFYEGSLKKHFYTFESSLEQFNILYCTFIFSIKIYF